MSSNHNPKRSSQKKKLKLSEPLSKTKKLPASPTSSGRASPDSACAICLGQHENKSFTNNCLHEFCFTCLLEWSKVKAECPLCKQAFSSIIHNVRSNHEYDEHKIPIMEPEEPDFSALDLVHHRFRYSSTVTPERRRALALERLYTLRQFARDGVLPNERRPTRSRLTGTSSFRRRTYQRDLWVRPLADITGRYRETTPEFFQLNPAMTHRLVPWLNRELNVLLASHENRLSYVLELILRLITQHHIRSRAFREAIQSYIGAYTQHFIHEFFQFARSPYDMYGFDENADYEPRNNLYHEEVAVSESSDEDVPGVRSRDTIQNRVAPRDIPLPPSPQPGPSGIGRNSVAIMIDDGQSYAANPGPSSMRRPSDEDEDDDEDVEIVQVVPPTVPEVITLSDTEEDQEEERERTVVNPSTSRGKALKKKSSSSVSPGNGRVKTSSRKDQRNKASKKKKRKRDRSPSAESASSSISNRVRSRETDENQPEPSRHQLMTIRYWDMDPDEIHRRLHSRQNPESQASGGSSGGGGGNGRRSRWHKRSRH